MKGKPRSPSRSSSRKRETTIATPNQGKAKKKPTISLLPSTSIPSSSKDEEPLLLPRAEEPPEGITRDDFQWFIKRTNQTRAAAGSIPFNTIPDWFDKSIGVAEKATYVKPGEQTKRGGVISNGEDKWFFLHSNNLCDLTGPGFMITMDMLPFLYQKWRQPKTIEKLQAARIQSTKPKVKHPTPTTEVMDTNPEANIQNVDGSNTPMEELSTDSTSQSDKEENEDESDGEDNELRDSESKDSVSTVEKECKKLIPSKPLYLNAVLKGKFNSFHILGKYRVTHHKIHFNAQERRQDTSNASA